MGIEWHTERRPTASLKDYPRNPRVFTEKGMADLKASIRALGYIDPIAINLDGTIIGGHARKETLLSLGLAEVDVRVPSRSLTPKEIEQAIIRLNKNTAGEWNFKVLEDSFNHAELIEWGFEKSEFNVFGAQGKTDPDEVPPIPSAAVTLPGDQWMLGDHTIRCGDATSAEDVVALLGGIKPHLMVTDPPYGVEYNAGWRNRVHRKDGSVVSGLAVGKVSNDDRSDWREAWALFSGEVAYVWHAGLRANSVFDSLTACDFEMRAQIIWAKQHLCIGRGHYHFKHEPCWYAVKKGKTGHWNGDRKQTTLWEIDKPQKSETGHSTQKPIECMKRPIENNSKLGDSVYEPFSGSGTTIIAAEMTGRRCYAMELNPLYVDMAVIRWQNFTGKKAVHATLGREFDTAEKPKKRKKA